MSVPKIIIELVERFDRNIDSYKNGHYNETQVRNEFINPFFEALGWDVINKAGYAEAYKDVIHEYSLKTKDVAKAPDYLFRIGSTKKFFVEAKKPSVNLKDDISPAFQLRRYAWTAKLPLSILTDFEELAIYDCRVQPKKNDKSSTARILYLTYKDYIDKWDKIEAIFSKDAVLKGSFDKFAETSKGKRGTTQVDDAFLSEIEKWREQLARNIALRNPNLTNRQLNYSVQKIIDRIIFLRISEDRGIEEYGQLFNLLNGTNVYKRLQQLFKRADEKYNSGLFHFDEEKLRTDPPDEITPTLTIDDKILKEIFKNLYYPDCPYEFSVLGTDILGHVYEQFLGKVIRLTAGHRAVIEEKPEVKKAGGVYYTPTYIVDYIVKNTVGKKLEELENKYNFMPDKVEAVPNKNQTNNFGIAQIKKIIKDTSKLKILDPACGSGSFLLGAYQYLLDWHLKIYTSNVEQISNLFVKKTAPIFRTRTNEYRLTTNEKKRILLNNIYGVDIDNQAVEVTKLSLLLKVLEGETDETLNTQITMFKERALPDLSSNIKCGNSLIGPDFYDQMEMNFLDEEEKLRINVFDWKTEFEEIMIAGGFDCVIGNPPYVFGGVYGIENYEKIYFSNKFISGKGKINLFAIFIEVSLTIMNKKGFLSFIIPNTILRVTSYKFARKYLLNNYNFKEIVDLGQGIFRGATTSSIIITIEKSFNKENEIEIKNKLFALTNKVLQREFVSEDSIMNINIDKRQIELIRKLKYQSIDLGDLCKEMIFGVVISKNKNEVIFDKYNENLKPFLEGKDITRYHIKPITKYLLYDPGKLHRARTKKIFEVPEKILIQRITGGNKPLNAAYDNKQYYNKESINNIILNQDTAHSIYFILALLNSKLINWFYVTSFTNKSKLTVNLSKTYLSQIPVKKINFDVDSKLIKFYDQIVNLSSLMIELSNCYYNVNNMPQEKTALQRQIEATDKQIDKLVYKLYGLTEEEIKIVEESF